MSTHVLSRRKFVQTGLALSSLGWSARPALATSGPDLALITAIDVSASMYTTNLLFPTIQAIAQVVASAHFAQMLTHSLSGQALIAFTGFGTESHLLVPPTLVTRAEANQQLAHISAQLLASIGAGGRLNITFRPSTNTAAGMAHGLSLLNEPSLRYSRRVLNIISDADPSREAWSLTKVQQGFARQQGITINALLVGAAQMNDKFHTDVITGPGAFVINNSDCPTLLQAVERKFIGDLACLAQQRQFG